MLALEALRDSVRTSCSCTERIRLLAREKEATVATLCFEHPPRKRSDTSDVKTQTPLVPADDHMNGKPHMAAALPTKHHHSQMGEYPGSDPGIVRHTMSIFSASRPSPANSWSSLISHGTCLGVATASWIVGRPIAGFVLQI